MIIIDVNLYKKIKILLFIIVILRFFLYIRYKNIYKIFLIYLVSVYKIFSWWFVKVLIYMGINCIYICRWF